MNRKRLRHLKSVLSNIDPNFRFDMQQFLGQFECRTAGCALGYASLDSFFQAEGLVPDIEHNTVRYLDHTSYGAGRVFFDLTPEQTDYLFNPGSYGHLDGVTPAIVIDRIKILLQE